MQETGPKPEGVMNEINEAAEDAQESVEQKEQQPESAEKPKLVELQSRDVSKYRTGQRFDNGRDKGVIRSIDYMNNKIFIEPDDNEQKLVA
jgi:hypothetical protein